MTKPGVSAGLSVGQLKNVLHSGIDVDHFAVLGKFNHAVNEGEEREITSATNIFSGMELCSALPDDDSAS